MQMPPDVKRDLEALENRVKEIHAQYIDAAKRDAEPYVRAIMQIRSLYPSPLLITDLEAHAFLLSMNEAKSKEPK